MSTCQRCNVSLPTAATGPLCDECIDAPERPMLATAEPAPVHVVRDEPTGAALLAIDLIRQLGTIAKRPDAGLFMRDLHNARDTIERLINRPIPPRYCGPCPTITDDGNHCGTRDTRGRLQRTALLAPREATEVTCRECKTVHDIAEIEKQLWDEVGEWLLSPSEILLVMDYFGEPIPESTFRRWRQQRKIPVRGYRNGKPRYWPDDARKLRNQRKA